MLDGFIYLPQDEYSKTIANLETDVARLHDDLVSLREEYHRLEKDSQAQIGKLAYRILILSIRPVSSCVGRSTRQAFSRKGRKDPAAC
jgi:hypothetical protein